MALEKKIVHRALSLVSVLVVEPFFELVLWLEGIQLVNRIFGVDNVEFRASDHRNVPILRAWSRMSARDTRLPNPFTEDNLLEHLDVFFLAPYCTFHIFSWLAPSQRWFGTEQFVALSSPGLQMSSVCNAASEALQFLIQIFIPRCPTESTPSAISSITSIRSRKTRTTPDRDYVDDPSSAHACRRFFEGVFRGRPPDLGACSGCVPG